MLAKKDQCFIISSLKLEYNHVYHGSIKRAVEENNLKCVKADDEYRIKNIPLNIIRDIIQSKIIIADVSEQSLSRDEGSFAQRPNITVKIRAAISG